MSVLLLALLLIPTALGGIVFDGRYFVSFPSMQPDTVGSPAGFAFGLFGKDSLLRLVGQTEERACVGLNETKFVKVAAQGDHSSVSLGIEGVPKEWVSVIPGKFSSLPDGSEAIFIITYSSSGNPGNYKVTYTAKSDSFESQASSIISFLSCEIPAARKDRVLLEISSLRAAARKIMIDAISKQSPSTKTVVRILEEAISDLDQAEKTVALSVPDAESLIQESMKGMEEAVTEMVNRPKQSGSYNIYIGVVGGIIAAVLIYKMYENRKTPPWRRPAKQYKFSDAEAYDYKRRLLKRLMEKLEK